MVRWPLEGDIREGMPSRSLLVAPKSDALTPTGGCAVTGKVQQELVGLKPIIHIGANAKRHGAVAIGTGLGGRPEPSLASDGTDGLLLEYYRGNVCFFGWWILAICGFHDDISASRVVLEE